MVCTLNNILYNVHRLNNRILNIKREHLKQMQIEREDEKYKNCYQNNILYFFFIILIEFSKSIFDFPMRILAAKKAGFRKLKKKTVLFNRKKFAVINYVVRSNSMGGGVHP